jgi:hypothetical protein
MLAAGAAGFLLSGNAWADMCANNGLANFNYTSGNVISNCSAWAGGTSIGDEPGLGTWNVVGSGGTQLIVSTTQQKLAFSPSSAANVATMTDSVNGGVLLSGIAAGLNTRDAVNVGQFSPVVSVLGGGASFNVTTGAVTGPSYALGNTNSIAGTSGAATNIGTGFAKIDSALGKLNTSVADNAASVTSITNQIINGTVGLVQQNAGSRTITVAGDTDGETVDITGTAGSRALQGVASGAVNGTSRQAVNGSQLYALASSTASALGGGSMVGSEGAVTPPAYTVAGQTVHNVGDALSNIDARTAQNSTDITDISTQINTGGVGLVRQDVLTRTITVARNTDGSIVDFTGAAGARTLRGVAAGAVNGMSDQAVNGSQLYAVASSTASALGGGAAVGIDGSITAPTYTVGGQTLQGVEAAFANIDNRTTQNTTDISSINTQINNGTIGLVQQDAVTQTVTVAKSTGGSVVNFSGQAGARILDGVANGAVHGASQQAVNGSQLYALASSTATAFGGGSTVAADGAITAPAYTVGGQTVQGVEAAITNLDGRTSQNAAGLSNLQINVTNNTAAIEKNTTDIADMANQINSGTVGLVQQDPASRRITVAASADGATVDMTGTEGARTVAGVAAGALSANSSEAVNGAQLWATNQELASITSRVQNFSAGGSAVLASQNSDTPAIASGTDSTAVGNGANASGNNSVAIGSGSVADQDNTVSIGSKDKERRLTNVAPGANGTDAVNMNQLHAVQNSVNTAARQAFAGVAAAMAMPNLTPSAPGKTVVAMGVGNYKGYSAVGLGGTYRSENNRWLINGAAAFTPHGDTGVRGQVGYEF